jgi:hypothetical protein
VRIVAETGLLERTQTDPDPAPEPGRRFPVRALLAPLPWLVPAAALVAVLVWLGVSGADIARYAGYLVLYIAVPGTLVHRLLRGSRGNVPEDVGYGAVTGLLLQLAVWALAAATGQQDLLRWWIVPVLVAFLAVPGWRRHWRVTDPRPLPLRWSWLMAVGLLVPVLMGVATWVTTPLPPAAADYYPDLMYHLGLVHEMTRSMPFQVPQLAGDELRYHYLSDADMATAAMITGIEPATVVLRLWLVPIGAIAALAFAALAREVTGVWWAGPVGGVAAAAGFPLALGSPLLGNGGSPLLPISPSQVYALPLMALFAALVVDVLRGRSLGVGWVLVPAVVVACAGAKSSALPPLAAGLLAGTVVAAIARRRVPWSALGLLAAVATGMLIGLRLFAGGGAGVLGVQPLSWLKAMPPYHRTIGQFDPVDRGGALFPLGVEHTDERGRQFLVAVIVWWLVMQSPRLLGLFGLATRRIGGDPVGWFLGGTMAAGVGATWLLYHPSASQGYFLLCAAPFGVILTLWFAVERARRWWTFALGAIAGMLWLIFAPQDPVPLEDTLAVWLDALWTPVWRALAAAGVAFGVAAVVVVVVRRRFPFRAGVAALAAAVVGAGLAAACVRQSIPVERYVTAPVTPDPRRLISRSEVAAALWVSENTGRDDVVATNVHCAPVHRTKTCDARAFWVSGLGGRRTVLESWGYSDATVAAHGVNDLHYARQPAPYPSLHEQNDRIFTDADPAALAELRQRYGVRWLFADSRAGTVSPDLATIATPRFTAGPVTVYEVG